MSDNGLGDIIDLTNLSPKEAPVETTAPTPKNGETKKVKPEKKPAAKPATKPAAKPVAKAAAKPATKPAAKPVAKAAAPKAAKPKAEKKPGKKRVAGHKAQCQVTMECWKQITSAAKEAGVQIADVVREALYKGLKYKPEAPTA